MDEKNNLCGTATKLRYVYLCGTGDVDLRDVDLCDLCDADACPLTCDSEIKQVDGRQGL